METFFPQMDSPGESTLRRPASACSKTTNVGEWERIASVFAGGGMLAGGLTHANSARGLAMILLGGGLVYRGLSGHCSLYGFLGVNTAERRNPAVGVPARHGERIEQSVVIDCGPEKLYEFWRDLSNLPVFIDRLESVTETGGNRSEWKAKGPVGMQLVWQAEIINEKPEELIAWRSLPGSEVDTAGSVHFLPLNDGAATEVRVTMKYDVPGGKASIALAKLIGDDPEQLLRDDLHRLKRAMEACDARAKAEEAVEREPLRGIDNVDEAAAESFPASDPPAVSSFTRGMSTSRPR